MSLLLRPRMTTSDTEAYFERAYVRRTPAIAGRTRHAVTHVGASLFVFLPRFLMGVSLTSRDHVSPFPSRLPTTSHAAWTSFCPHYALLHT